MPIRKYKPTSPGRRFQTVQVFDEITTNEPHRPLTESLKRSGGRNNTGELTSWWRGGGHRRLYRIIDFKRDQQNRRRDHAADERVEGPARAVAPALRREEAADDRVRDVHRDRGHDRHLGRQIGCHEAQPAQRAENPRQTTHLDRLTGRTVVHRHDRIEC